MSETWRNFNFLNQIADQAYRNGRGLKSNTDLLYTVNIFKKSGLVCFGTISFIFLATLFKFVFPAKTGEIVYDFSKKTWNS